MYLGVHRNTLTEYYESLNRPRLVSPLALCANNNSN